MDPHHYRLSRRNMAFLQSALFPLPLLRSCSPRYSCKIAPRCTTGECFPNRHLLPASQPLDPSMLWMRPTRGQVPSAALRLSKGLNLLALSPFESASRVSATWPVRRLLLSTLNPAHRSSALRHPEIDMMGGILRGGTIDNGRGSVNGRRRTESNTLRPLVLLRSALVLPQRVMVLAVLPISHQSLTQRKQRLPVTREKTIQNVVPVIQISLLPQLRL
jgi:hypothetical protein